MRKALGYFQEPSAGRIFPPQLEIKVTLELLASKLIREASQTSFSMTKSPLTAPHSSRGAKGLLCFTLATSLAHAADDTPKAEARTAVSRQILPGVPWRGRAEGRPGFRQVRIAAQECRPTAV